MMFRRKRLPGLGYVFIAIFVALLLIAIAVKLTPLSLPLSSEQNQGKTGQNTQEKTIKTQPSKGSNESRQSSNSTADEKAKITQNLAKKRYGHLAYKQADPDQMMLVASYATGKNQRFESLRPKAAKALMRMIYAARDDGIWIVPVSGFRSWERQNKLFQEQVERRGSRQKAAQVSAPPGYSEHHTGFAIDLADGRFPKKDISDYFQYTKAYDWLKQNAKQFGFELSFHENNAQGVSFEPWHWRYIGTPRAKELFAKAR